MNQSLFSNECMCSLTTANHIVQDTTQDSKISDLNTMKINRGILFTSGCLLIIYLHNLRTLSTNLYYQNFNIVLELADDANAPLFSDKPVIFESLCLNGRY
jgi:hypothetical protein